MVSRPAAAFALEPWAHRLAFPEATLDRLCRVVAVERDTVLTSFDTPAAHDTLATVEILISGWGCPRIDRQTLTAAPRLRAVVHAAGTVKRHVDAAVYKRGIVVSSAAQANATPVAEYTVAALILGAKEAFSRARRYADADPGRWPSRTADGLSGSTVGIIGASRVGRLVLRRLRDFEVTVLLADPHVTGEQARELGAELVDLDTLCARSDLVTVHAPALPETRGLLGERRLALMPDGAVLVNTARGSLVDTEVLARHCTAGRLSAVLDVTDPEPLPADHPLFALDNVFITPHLAGAEGREARRLGEFATAEIERFVRGDPLLGRVEPHQLGYIA